MAHHQEASWVLWPLLRCAQGPCWTHLRRLACKSHAHTRTLTEDEVIALRSEFESELENPAVAKVRKVAAAKARSAAQWKPPESAPDVEYKMTFGKYSGPRALTVIEVNERNSGYFKSLMSWRNNILEMRPDLKLALERAGLLADLVAERPQLLKAPLPRFLSGRTPLQRERVDVLVRAMQFRRMTCNGDKWVAFCEGARHWMREHGYHRPRRGLKRASLSKLARNLGKRLALCSAAARELQRWREEGQGADVALDSAVAGPAPTAAFTDTEEAFGAGIAPEIAALILAPVPPGF